MKTEIEYNTMKELYMRVGEIAKKTLSVTIPPDVYERVKKYAKSKVEVFGAIYLDSASVVIGASAIFKGTLNRSIVHPREIFYEAIKRRAASIIIFHNHPSGSLEPSGEDMVTTKRIKDAGEIIGIRLLDHIIISKAGFVSLGDTGRMPL